MILILTFLSLYYSKFQEIVHILNDGEIIGRLINHVSILLSAFIQQPNHQANYSYIGSSNIVLFLTVINNLIHTLSIQPFIQQLDLNDVLLDSNRNNSNNNNNDNMNNFHKYLSWIDEEWILKSLTYRQIEVNVGVVFLGFFSLHLINSRFISLIVSNTRLWCKCSISKNSTSSNSST